MLKINRLPCKSSTRSSLASSVRSWSLGSVFTGVHRMESLGLWILESAGLAPPAAASSPLQGGCCRAGCRCHPPEMGCHSQPSAICTLSQWPQLSQKLFFQLDFKLSMRLCLVPRAQVGLEVADSAFLALLILPSPPLSFLVSCSPATLLVLKSCCVMPQKMVMV